MHELAKKVIVAEAPVRFDFGGGPTDVEPFKTREHGFVVNAAVKRLAHIKIKPRDDSKIILRSRNFKHNETFTSLDNLNLNGPLRLLKAAVKYVKPNTGMEITTLVDVPPGSGLGGSASLAIALLGALKTLKGETVTNTSELVADALYIENVMLNNINGGQDQYAAALGGFHAFNFDGDKVSVKNLNVSKDTISQIENRSILCYTGESHVSGDVLNSIMGNYEKGKTGTVTALREMKDLAHEVEQALVLGNVDKFGVLIREVGLHQRSYHPNIHPKSVRDLFDLAEKFGAVGGKLAGAGGGGVMYLFCHEGRKKDVQSAMLKLNVPLIPMKFATDGVMIKYE